MTEKISGIETIRMKIIDLLNLWAIDKALLPKQITVLSNNEVFTFEEQQDEYIGENGDGLFNECILNAINLQSFLNDEIERKI